MKRKDLFLIPSALGGVIYAAYLMFGTSAVSAWTSGCCIFGSDCTTGQSCCTPPGGTANCSADKVNYCSNNPCS